MTDGTRSRGRERQHDLGETSPDERARLSATLGALLRIERGALTQQQLADRAGLSRDTIACLEVGIRRPTTSSVWKIAQALRPGGPVRDQVALDERLRQAAGASLRDYGTRPHSARERVRAELLAEAAGGSVVSEGDTLAAVTLGSMARLRASGGVGDRGPAV